MTFYVIFAGGIGYTAINGFGLNAGTAILALAAGFILVMLYKGEKQNRTESRQLKKTA
ncbi:Uncharacterised protein [Mycobacteroides abscessus subsp. abscessus]|nr:Uncharacterised protein [Mycobacteroides abscessus subsp. abscessus]